MRAAPKLNEQVMAKKSKEDHILLINPFYPKDPISSFGKHVLTPSLALTSIAASTPDRYHVAFWDENLLQGPPPYDPFPKIVGITVHITFAKRAYQLAKWYRSRGAIVVMGGQHVTSCPDEVAPHADIIVKGNGVRVWPQVLRDIEMNSYKEMYEGKFDKSYGEEPFP